MKSQCDRVKSLCRSDGSGRLRGRDEATGEIRRGGEAGEDGRWPPAGVPTPRRSAAAAGAGRVDRVRIQAPPQQRQALLLLRGETVQERGADDGEVGLAGLAKLLGARVGQ